MKFSANSSAQEVILEFENVDAYERFFEDAQKDGFFLLQLESLSGDAGFVARAAGSLRSRKIRPVEIVKVDGGHQVWISPRTKEQPSEPETRKAPGVEKEGQSKSLRDRIRAMPMTERVTLAKHGDLHERRILMQENNVKIHEFLLRNPRITEGEIAWIARNPASPIQTLLAIIQHKSWMGLEGIRGGILTNPKTPAALVQDMIPLLSAGDLIKMHHAKLLREDVRDAVHREMKKRGIRLKE